MRDIELHWWTQDPLRFGWMWIISHERLHIFLFLVLPSRNIPIASACTWVNQQSARANTGNRVHHAFGRAGKGGYRGGGLNAKTNVQSIQQHRRCVERTPRRQRYQRALQPPQKKEKKERGNVGRIVPV